MKLLAVFFCIVSPLIYAGEVYEQFPELININARYVFYSHGLIVEGDNPTPISPRWGLYDFPAIKAALADDGYHLIVYHRASNTDRKEFAKKLTVDVQRLITAGVRAENITLLGFSRGGDITILASGFLKAQAVNVGLLASCPNFMKDNAAYRVFGAVYSIYERSDNSASCQFLIDQSTGVTSFEEIAISTGKEHGAFFRPLPEWIIPLKNWLNRQRY